MILKGESAEEFNRKADENYEKFKARQKQNLIDMMEADEELGLYDTPKKLYTIEDIERCVENWGLCKVEREYIEKFLEITQNKEDKEYTLSDIAELLMQSESLPASVLILEELLKDYHRQLLNQNKEDERKAKGK